MAKGIKSSIYLSEELRNKLRVNENKGTSSAVSITVDRYDLIRKNEEKYLLKLFSETELKEIASLCKETVFVPVAVCKNGILSIVQENEIENKSELIKKLSELSITQQIILIEIIEQLNSI